MKKYILFIMFLAVSFAVADSAIDGLTLALNPDGKTIVVAGDNRTIYTLDAATLEVLERTYFGSSINKMRYSADGSVLFVQDSEPNIYVLDADTLQTKSKLSDYGMMHVSTEAKIMVAVDPDYNGDSLAIFDISKNKLTSIAEISFEKDEDIASIGINSDGSKLAVFFDDFDSETEEKVSWSDIPDEYKGFEREVYSRKHDGKEARFITYSIPDLEVLADYVSFYTPYDKELVFFHGEDVYITNQGNRNARFSPNGDVEMWEWQGIGSTSAENTSADQNILVVGGYGQGTVYDISSESGFNFDIDKLPGASESFIAFAVADDGTIYGTTSAYRVVKMKLAGAGISKIVKEVY